MVVLVLAHSINSKDWCSLWMARSPAASRPHPDSASLHCKPAVGPEGRSTDQTDLWPAPVNTQTNGFEWILTKLRQYRSNKARQRKKCEKVMDGVNNNSIIGNRMGYKRAAVQSRVDLLIRLSSLANLTLVC